MTGNILILDDQRNIRDSLALVLESVGHRVMTFADPFLAWEQVGETDLALVDICLGQDVNGLHWLEKCKKLRPDLPVIMMSGEASREEVVQAVRLGVYDFIEKPIRGERLKVVVRNAVEQGVLRQKLLEREAPTLLGQSPQFTRVLDQARKVSQNPSPVLIQGESGTGKEGLARFLHDASPRKHGPFVAVNCAAFTATLLDSELFGHEAGSFTGADRLHRGVFEAAHGGTVFLDEVGELSPEAQAKLLRVLQNQEVRRVGAPTPITVDVRVIAATHRDLKTGFREDLYYRLSVLPIMLPPLREREGDLELLIQHFLKDGISLSPEALEALKQYAFPGNIRELQNMMERVVCLGQNPVHLLDLPPEVLDVTSEVQSEENLAQFRASSERVHLVKTLKGAGGNVSEAARRLGVERTYLHRLIKRHSIEKREFF